MPTHRSLVATGFAAFTLLLGSSAFAAWLPGYSFPLFGRLPGPGGGLVGHDLNGISWNTTFLDGRQVAFVPMTAYDEQGQPVDVVLVDSALRPTVGKGKGAKEGVRAAVGLHFDGILDDGDVLPLRVEEAWRSDVKGMRDLWCYRIAYWEQEGWSPLCGTDEAGEAIPAMVLAGRWDLSEGTVGGGSHIDDPHAMTVACRGHVAAKCVEAATNPEAAVKRPEQAYP